MAMGMSAEEYWHGESWLARYYYQADRIRQERENTQAWLNGAYVHQALVASLGNMFKKPGGQMFEYPSEPIRLFHDFETEQETEERKEKEALLAEAWMQSFVTAGQTWGLEEGTKTPEAE